MKNKFKNPLYFISITLAVFVLFLSVGYAFFTDSLTINGVASTVDYYSGDMLPTSPIMLEPDKNRYHTYDTSRSKLSWRSDYWVGDTLVAIWNKGSGMAALRRTITYTASFSNPTELSYTNGQVSTEILKNDSSFIKDASATLSKTTLNPGEAVEIKLSVTSNFLTRFGEHDIKATVSYELQGERKYFYFILKYRGWNDEE